MDSSPHSAWLKDQVAFASRVAVVGDYRDRRSFIEHSFEVEGLGCLFVNLNRHHSCTCV